MADWSTPKDSPDELACLSEHERAIIKRQIDVPAVNVTFLKLFQYATRTDLVIIFISVFCAAIGGAALPIPAIIFASLTDTLQGYAVDHTVTAWDLQSALSRQVHYYVYLAAAEFVVIYISVVGFIYTGDHITQKFRVQYLAAIMRQNVAYFDKLGAGEITTCITSDMDLIQDGISEKIALTLAAVIVFFSAFIIGIIKYWSMWLSSIMFTGLSLILFSIVLTTFFVVATGSVFMIRFKKQALSLSGPSSTLADEAISSIRNVVAFNTQEKLATQYDMYLNKAKRADFKMRSVVSVTRAFIVGAAQLSYAIAFWQGSQYIVAGEMTLQQLLTILLETIIGTFALTTIGPNIQAFGAAIAAAGKIMSVIERASSQDPGSEEGMKLDHVNGTIELRNVKHIYPSRPGSCVMDDLNLIVPAGKTTALVGASGSGKSTIIGLIERFYEPVGGQILLDGCDISTLNLRWLRRQMSLVSQEPVLFGTSIFENIAYGLTGTPYENATKNIRMELVVKAAMKANAHDFISALPEGYGTHVGERGSLLSGGQKQRIAISRAIVSDPKILLLDEATSALDTKSESVVQAALDAAAKGRTTIIVAHRLSTIKNAHNIVVMSKGRIVEQGTHDYLLEQKSTYYNLIQDQKLMDENEERSARQLAKSEDVSWTTSSEITDSQSWYNENWDDEKALIRSGQKITTKSLGLFGYTNFSSPMRILTRFMRRSDSKGKLDRTHQGYSSWTPIRMLVAFNAKDWRYMLVGLIFSVIAGATTPTQALFFAKSIVDMARPPSQYAELRHDANFWTAMFLMLAIVIFLSYSIQGVSLELCSERLTFRAQSKAFRHILRQDIAFFDRDENTVGALTAFLSTEPTNLTGISGVVLGTFLTVAVTLSGSLTLGIATGWKLGLVCAATVPVLLACGFLRLWMIAQFRKQSKKAYISSTSYASEAVSAIRTVASLTREDDVLKHYQASLEAQRRKSLFSVLKSTILYAMSESFVFLCTALGSWYGGQLILTGEYDMFEFFLCYLAIVVSAQSAGRVFAFAPDMGKAENAAQELKRLFDRKPEIDSWSSEGWRPEKFERMLEFIDVHFRYPTRPDIPVLRGLSLTVKPGQYIALVGASGCGKSTAIALLERFYSPSRGCICIDGKDISSLNITHYRNFIALVSQEPTLYHGTILENILHGINSHDVDERVIAQACKDANIYDFITSLPDGFNTIVGSGGILLSGGQKQRVAIARAIVRDPKILLLDEATSALDSESEKAVQVALDRAARGRTTIAIAHRLSTIQNADIIYVLDNGRVVEHGTHAELLSKRRRYFELINLQNLEKRH